MDLEKAPFDMLLKEVQIRRAEMVNELCSVVANVFRLWFKTNGVKVPVVAARSQWVDDCIRVCATNNPTPIMQMHTNPESIYPVLLDFDGESPVKARDIETVIKRIGRWVNEPEMKKLLLKEYGEERHGRDT